MPERGTARAFVLRHYPQAWAETYYGGFNDRGGCVWPDTDPGSQAPPLAYGKNTAQAWRRAAAKIKAAIEAEASEVTG